MISIGSYFVFITCAMEVIYAGPKFNIMEHGHFNELILKEHNEYRKLHHASPLQLKKLPNTLAHNYLHTLWREIPQTSSIHKVNILSVKLNEDSELDAELAKNIVATWYKTGENYNYENEPKSIPTDADPFSRIVWQGATELGVWSEVKDDELHVVAYYLYIDFFEENYKDNVKQP